MARPIPLAACWSSARSRAERHEKNWKGLSLAFVSINVPLNRGRGSDALREHVERELALAGKPVRWAIVAADDDSGMCKVDAVVSREGSKDVTSTSESEVYQDDSNVSVAKNS